MVNDDLLGSMEFACAVAGAKAVVVFGHTACGAVKGAIDDVEMGNLTGLLARIKPAITATTFDGEKSSKNPAYVDAVARTNVAVTLESIRRRSPILADLEKKGSIRIAGAMYDLATGKVEFRRLERTDWRMVKAALARLDRRRACRFGAAAGGSAVSAARTPS